MVDSSKEAARNNDNESQSRRPSRGVSKTDTNIRGRSVQPEHQPSSWIRSASTSSLLRLKRNDAGHARGNTNSIEKGRSESLSRSSDALKEGVKEIDGNVFIDVLPSFEMYNTLHRHIPQGNVDPDRHDFPPCYQEVQTQRNSILRATDQPERLSLDVPPSSRRGSTSPIPLNTLHNLSTQHLSLRGESSAPHDEDNIMIEDDVNDADNINIDKLYSLPKLATPVDIDIRIAKGALKPHVKPEEESMLKEYTSGETIHGYCVLENKSSHRLKFEMFYVTLEGYISVIDKQKGKRTLKRFLRMVDLSASWSYTHIDVSSGVKYIPGDIDFDHAVMGLNNNRVLEPGRKYKKFFMFKLPNQLLDVACKQEQFSHCLLPPSFGIDKYRNSCKFAGIKVNSILGCGHLGIKGSPILTSDMADDSLSINYTVDARLVGKDHKTQKLNIMREHEYNLRVIPFGFSSPVIGERVSSQQLKDLSSLVRERLDALHRIFERLKDHQPIHSTDIHGTDISGTVDEAPELDSDEILARKMDQLHMNNRISTQHDLFKKKDGRIYNGEATYVEAQLSYKLKSKSSSNLKGGLFTGFRNSLSTPQSPSHEATKENPNKLGLMVLTAKVPDLALPYWSPSLLRKKNRFEEKNDHDQENWLRLSSLVPDDLKAVLQHIDIQLECIQSNNSKPHEPPEIQSVTTELLCITAKSDNSIPIKLDAKMLLSKEKVHHINQQYGEFLSEIQRYNDMFDENIDELNELYNMSRTSIAPKELKFTDFISTQIRGDVESLANLNIKVVILPDVFKKQIHTLKNISQDYLTPEVSSTSLHKSTSGSFLSGTFSGSSSDLSRSSTSAKFTEQIVREWVSVAPSKYQRDVKINLEYNQNIRETLVPSFESCLCCHFYCVRVNIKFENHIGTATIDIPVCVKKLHA
ncbi:ubiquitin-ubiquitin ligase BUL2 TDEL_0B00630 [Torulaspora delbrueckii]|mgnify:CR=1 FL=1|uniref:Bul1 N-terminal domain-containing protein n=1 Tax=Torulaspora delbrueckii TaxID=4950 RepID=G8ZNJ8_TORDE|nr:hypothetical protein TDEL_0B00630 [Torulaspora delbrueckii]CCE90192.1 hypothetical protein TDEL_0B00630 [Torulaspora delbrueckii]